LVNKSSRAKVGFDQTTWNFY